MGVFKCVVYVEHQRCLCTEVGWSYACSWESERCSCLSCELTGILPSVEQHGKWDPPSFFWPNYWAIPPLLLQYYQIGPLPLQVVHLILLCKQHGKWEPTGMLSNTSVWAMFRIYTYSVGISEICCLTESVLQISMLVY